MALVPSEEKLKQKDLMVLLLVQKKPKERSVSLQKNNCRKAKKSLGCKWGPTRVLLKLELLHMD